MYMEYLCMYRILRAVHDALIVLFSQEFSRKSDVVTQ
jgi:hypothetical protein